MSRPAHYGLAMAFLLAITARADDAPKLDGPLAAYSFQEATPADEALIFTPPGFDKPGIPAKSEGPTTAHLTITVRDAATGKPTPCRLNVVGPDGNYYEPNENPLTKYSLTGQWPKPGAWGNREGKAPIRYFGRFFYTRGESRVDVPAGTVHIEAWKGLEYTPATTTIRLEPGGSASVELLIRHSADLTTYGYASGDPHVHIPRTVEDDDSTIFDLMAAEDIRVATLLAYNEPPGPYDGTMDAMASTQNLGLGAASIRSRDDYWIISGQEYRSGTYGHLNLFLLDELVLPGQKLNANDWPLYGDVIRKARKDGGLAWYAHGGYAQAIYADAVQGNLDAVELLQFGVYRGIGLEDWYRFWNCGFVLPAVGACDYPACRKLGDCVTYVHDSSNAESWLRAAAKGRSFVTTGPLLILEVQPTHVDETDRSFLTVRPGGRLISPDAASPRVRARVRVRSEVTPVTDLHLIVNGRVVQTAKLEGAERQGTWVERTWNLNLDCSSWIAARAFSLSKLGTPDAEAHTNPVRVIVDGKAPFERESLDELLKKLDAQIAAQKARDFPEKARVLAYFDRSRDILVKLREAGGIAVDRNPADLVGDDAAAFDPSARTHNDEELRAYLKPVPPKPIEEVLKSFETVGGFRMELVAREPLVVDPVAGAFDENGNLYVAEMRDYPYKPKEGDPPLGCVRLLRDTNGDGTFDESHVFADRLLWAAGVAPWKGGVFVAAPPDIWYFQDTDGDFQADLREKVFTGFGTQNQQAMLNNLQWWHDGMIYGATAGNGGKIRPGNRPDAPPIDVTGRDFRFDPVTRRFETITGTVQFGNTFNDWGDRFVCSESRPLIHIVLPESGLARNPYLSVPTAMVDLAPAPVPIFRISPVERWRQVRSSRRIAAGERVATGAGASHHVVDAAAGVTVYRGGAYPPEMSGTVFVCDPQNNLIHHRSLEPDGVTYKSKRIEEGTEFVRSSDTWFRPVNLLNAPDGTLYILDLSREILESIHIPDDVVKHLDLTSGRDTGRIYRLAPPGFRYPVPPRLGRASTLDLVATLDSPHGWYRDTAARLLKERRDPTAIAPLRAMLVHGKTDRARVGALWALHNENTLTLADLQNALSSPSPRVREQAVCVAEPHLGASADLLQAALSLADDDDPRVRFQLAFALGSVPTPATAQALSRIARRSVADPWIRTAVLSSSASCAADILVELMADDAFGSSPDGAQFLRALLSVWGARARDDEVSRALLALTRTTDCTQQRHLTQALGDGLRRAGRDLDPRRLSPGPARHLLASLLAEAGRVALDPDADHAAREDSIRLLACAPWAQTGETLAALLDPSQPESIQAAAIRGMAGHADAAVTACLLERWRTFTPGVRPEAIDAMLGRKERTLALLRLAARDTTVLATIHPGHRGVLRQHNDPQIAALAAQVFGTESRGDRERVVTQYRAALALPRSATRGETVFRRECAACHQLGSIGNAVGPNLASSSNRDPDALLVHILDPNRYVMPEHLVQQVSDVQGRVFTGLVASLSATSLTLLREEGRTDTILRKDIAQSIVTDRSIMPEGLESRITPAEMADLIGFLLDAQGAAPAAPPPLGIGTQPGLVEPESPHR